MIAGHYLHRSVDFNYLYHSWLIIRSGSGKADGDVMYGENGIDIGKNIKIAPQILNNAGHNIIMTHRGDQMSSTIVDPRYRITLPRDIREESDINPGDRLTFLRKGEQILIFKIPENPLLAMKGSLHMDKDPREFLRKLKEEDLGDEESEGLN
jgi:AbrB family looped-hinge helix DNA binding protein